MSALDPVRIVKADITTLDVDAIVNAANERMLGGGGVDGAIHQAAGPKLKRACRDIEEVRPGVRCPTGESRITPGFELPARHVIHTVGPVWHGGESGEPELLESCYRSALELGREHGVRTIAFPAISCGVYGYPPERAASVVRETLEDELAAGHYEEVLLVAFDDDVRDALEAAFRDRRGAA